MPEIPKLDSGRPFPEVLANLRLQETNLILLFAEVLELLRLCKERHQLGPVDEVTTPATTVIQNTLWIPWISGNGTWMIYGLFGEGPDAGHLEGKITQHGFTGDGK